MILEQIHPDILEMAKESDSILSDIYKKGENHIQFDEYLKQASQSSANMCYHLVSTLSQ